MSSLFLWAIRASAERLRFLNFSSWTAASRSSAVDRPHPRWWCFLIRNDRGIFAYYDEESSWTQVVKQKHIRRFTTNRFSIAPSSYQLITLRWSSRLYKRGRLWCRAGNRLPPTIDRLGQWTVGSCFREIDRCALALAGCCCYTRDLLLYIMEGRSTTSCNLSGDAC